MTGVRTDQVSVTVNATTLIDAVTIDVEDDSFYIIVGPNGSGKSTLLKTLYRALAPSRGAVFIDGTDISKQNHRSSAKMRAALPQHPSHAPGFTVRQVVAMGRTPHTSVFALPSASSTIVDDALTRVGIAEWADRDTSTLSGGERQRVFVARALAQEATLIVLDEPTNHLDPAARYQLMELLASLDVTVVAALHDLELAVEYADKIALMHQGHLIASGSPSEVVTPHNLSTTFGIRSQMIVNPITGRSLLVTAP